MPAAPHSDLERLQLLREIDRSSRWYSLDDKRVCGLCERLFSGREIRFLPQPPGRDALRCPTEDCPAIHQHWLVWSGREEPPTSPADSGEFRFL